MVVNGGFETGLDGWQWFGSGTNVATTSTDTPSGTGNSADLDVNEVLGLPWLIQDVPVEAGQKLTFSVWVREVEQFLPEFDAWIAAQVYMLPSSDSGQILASDFLLFTDPTWHQGSFDIVVPESATIARILFTPQDPDFGVGTGQYRIDDVSLTAAPSALPGDFNDDGLVDSDDLVIWQSGYGVGTTQYEGDANGDGTVDGMDFLIWQRNLTSGVTLVSALSVPEPGCSEIFMLMGIPLLFLFNCRHPVRSCSR